MEIIDVIFSLSILVYIIVDVVWSRMIFSRLEDLEHCRILYGITLQQLIDDVIELQNNVMED